MRIGVELFQLVEGANGGIVPLLQGVLEALFDGWPGHEVVLFCTPANEGLFPAVPDHVHRLVLPREGYFALLDVHASHLRLDVLLRSYPYDVDFFFPPSRQVVLIPDLQHEFFPEFFDPETLRIRRASFDRALGESAAVATLTEHSRRTLLDHPATHCNDIFLMSPALRTQWERPTEDALTGAERGLLPAGDFLLYPANLWPHKNHRRILEAFGQALAARDRPAELLLTGHPAGWETLAKDFPGLPVRHLGFVRRGFLQVLLARARGLAFFSLFEGFGMPLLEAFAAGTPVACSNTTSLPEVGGDAVLACDPTDVAAVAGLMGRLLDEDLRAELAGRGRQRLDLFNWHQSAAQFVAAGERLLARNPAPRLPPATSINRLNRFLLEMDTDRVALRGEVHRLAGLLERTKPSRGVALARRLARVPRGALRYLKRLARPA